jgi:hypothetical protein
MKGPVGGHPGEEASTATSSSFYDPSTNTIQTATGNPPSLSADPISAVRAALHDGRAQLMGSTVTDGVPTYKIRFRGKGGGFGSDSLVAYVDQHTYRPLLLSDPQRNGTTVQLRVVTFEYLPATPANLRLLSLTARHPGARVVAVASSESPAGSK